MVVGSQKRELLRENELDEGSGGRQHERWGASEVSSGVLQVFGGVR